MSARFVIAAAPTTKQKSEALTPTKRLHPLPLEGSRAPRLARRGLSRGASTQAEPNVRDAFIPSGGSASVLPDRFPRRHRTPLPRPRLRQWKRSSSCFADPSLGMTGALPRFREARTAREFHGESRGALADGGELESVVRAEGLEPPTFCV